MKTAAQDDWDGSKRPSTQTNLAFSLRVLALLSGVGGFFGCVAALNAGGLIVLAVAAATAVEIVVLLALALTLDAALLAARQAREEASNADERHKEVLAALAFLVDETPGAEKLVR